MEYDGSEAIHRETSTDVSRCCCCPLNIPRKLFFGARDMAPAPKRVGYGVLGSGCWIYVDDCVEYVCGWGEAYDYQYTRADGINSIPLLFKLHPLPEGER